MRVNFCIFGTVRKEVDKMNGETYLIGRRVHMKSFTHAINNMRKSIFFTVRHPQCEKVLLISTYLKIYPGTDMQYTIHTIQFSYKILPISTL